MDREKFQQEIYTIVSAIPRGRVVSYGQIAYLMGKPQCSRMVGYALHHAPESLHLPCYRVVNSQGRLVPGWPEQKTLLENEGVKFKKNNCVDMQHFQWNFTEEFLE